MKQRFFWEGSVVGSVKKKRAPERDIKSSNIRSGLSRRQKSPRKQRSPPVGAAAMIGF